MDDDLRGKYAIFIEFNFASLFHYSFEINHGNIYIHTYFMPLSLLFDAVLRLSFFNFHSISFCVLQPSSSSRCRKPQQFSLLRTLDINVAHTANFKLLKLWKFFCSYHKRLLQMMILYREKYNNFIISRVWVWIEINSPWEENSSVSYWFVSYFLNCSKYFSSTTGTCWYPS